MNKISVDEFIKGYFGAEDKGEYLRSHIVHSYIPFAEKINICEKIANVVTHATVGKGKKAKNIFWIDTNLRDLFTKMEMINSYTDIDLSFKDGKYIEIYDKLSEHYTKLDQTLLEEVLYCVPYTERTSFCKIVNNIVSDIRVNETNPVNYFETKIDSFNAVFDGLSKKIAKRFDKILSNKNIESKIEELLIKELSIEE